MKLAIITTHPIQYYAPVFQLLHQRAHIAVKVFYTLGPGNAVFDKGFAQNVTWDIPLLEGYPYEWARNTAPNPGTHHFRGIITPGLAAQVSSSSPDAILVIGWAYHSHLETIRYFKKKVPVLFRGDSTLLDEAGGPRSIFRGLFLKWVYRHVSHAFFNGANNRAYFKKYGLGEGQLTYAPHAVDNERFGCDRSSEALELRNKLGLTYTDILVLFAGKFEEKKAPEQLFDAVLGLNDPKVHILFTGGGLLSGPLKTKARNHPGVHFLDFQNQTFMPVVYQACDLFCLPSKGPAETWGLAVNEAMACSKAVLVSDKCGCAIDLVHPQKNGAIFKSGSPSDLLSWLKKLTMDRELLNRYGRSSLAIIKPFNFLHIATAIEKVMLNK